MNQTEVISYVIMYGRIEVHDGHVDGCKQTPYYHPNVKIYGKGSITKSMCSRATLNYHLLNKIQEMGFRPSQLVDNGGKKRGR